MELWVILSISAAAAQTVRFAVQKALSVGILSPAGATWARFFWSFPVVAAVMLGYLVTSDSPFPDLSEAFWLFALFGGLTQILATICTVALFKHRAFAVGITFKKTEVMLTALAGLIILGDAVSTIGAAAIALGFLGVVLLSEPPDGGSLLNRATALGLASGVFFALSAVAYRGATLELDTDDLLLRSGVTLALVTGWQTAILGLWLRFREPGQITATIRSWRISSMVGLFSLIGSWCWFAAFSLQSAAYVFAVGQIELIFSLAMGALWFREKIGSRETLGMAVLTASIIVVAIVG
jgi:drug/metabolite transporter (DMT)-like permease